MHRALAKARNESEPLAGRAWQFYRVMIRARLFEKFCSDRRKAGEVLGNTYPSEGQEAIGVAGLALTPEDVIFPSYRSRPIFFGKGVTVAQHFAELIGGPDATLGGREVFHHSTFPQQGVMPASSMIGGWVPMAAGHAFAQKMDGEKSVSVCCIGDGVLGAGDLHEALNMAGVWKLPFVLLCENNGYQAGSSWDTMRVTRSLEVYAEPYGFATRPVDGNDPFDVYQSMVWARRMALSGRPAMLDCHTFRMGGYASHFTVVRENEEEQLAHWRERDPIKFIKEWLIENASADEDELKSIADGEQKAIESAYADALAKSGANR